MMIVGNIFQFSAVHIKPLSIKADSYELYGITEKECVSDETVTQRPLLPALFNTMEMTVTVTWSHKPVCILKKSLSKF